MTVSVLVAYIKTHSFSYQANVSFKFLAENSDYNLHVDLISGRLDYLLRVLFAVKYYLFLFL